MAAPEGRTRAWTAPLGGTRPRVPGTCLVAGTLCFGPHLHLPSPKGFCPTIRVPSITCGGGGDYPGQSRPVIEQQPKKKKKTQEKEPEPYSWLPSFPSPLVSERDMLVPKGPGAEGAWQGLRYIPGALLRPQDGCAC